jgi:hypothetical protein
MRLSSRLANTDSAARRARSFRAICSGVRSSSQFSVIVQPPPTHLHASACLINASHRKIWIASSDLAISGRAPLKWSSLQSLQRSDPRRQLANRVVSLGRVAGEEMEKMLLFGVNIELDIDSPFLAL